MAASHRAIHLTLSPKNSARKTTCSATHRSQHSRLRFQPPPRSPHLRFLFRVFRVFRGEPWFPVANTVIEQVHALLARAKAHATVAGPRNPRSRHSAFFRVFRGQKKTHPRFLFRVFRVFRVFRGERWFPVENSVIEQVHSLLARAKAHATVSGPRNPRSRHSAFFRVFPRQKERHTRSQNNLFCHPPFTTFPAPLSASPEIATPTISFPCLPCLPW